MADKVKYAYRCKKCKSIITRFVDPSKEYPVYCPRCLLKLNPPTQSWRFLDDAAPRKS